MALFRCGAGTPDLNATIILNDSTSTNFPVKKGCIYLIVVEVTGGPSPFSITGVATTAIESSSQFNGSAGSGYRYGIYIYKADEDGTATTSVGNTTFIKQYVYEIEA